MVLLGLHLVSIAALCLKEIAAIDKEGMLISDFVETIIEEKTCGGVITTSAEPRDPGEMSYMNDCIICNDGLCYPMDECPIRRRLYQRTCDQIANYQNKNGQCDGGFGIYRCYRKDIHTSLELPPWKPVCVCKGLGGTNCKSRFVKERKCSIAVQDVEEECYCLVNVKLQSRYRK